MAGFGGGGTTASLRGKTGSWNTSSSPAIRSNTGSIGPKRVPSQGRNTGSVGPRRTQAGPQVTQAGPRITQAGPRITQAGPSLGAPQTSSLPTPKPISISAPKPGKPTNIDVSSERNSDLDELLGQQRDYVDDLKKGTGFAADVASLRTADAFEGAKNAAQYSGGEGKSGVRDTRQQQLTDAQLRAQAGQQANLALGREQMVGGALQSQLPTIMGQQSGMLGQQGIGLQLEGLRQQAGRDQFSQGLAGQRFAADVGFRNQDNAWRAGQQQLQGLQGVQGLYGGPWGPTGWGGGY